MPVTRETIKLCNHYGSLPVATSCGKRCGELRHAVVEIIRALPRLDLGELGNDLEALSLSEASYSRALCVKTKAQICPAHAC